MFGKQRLINTLKERVNELEHVELKLQHSTNKCEVQDAIIETLQEVNMAQGKKLNVLELSLQEGLAENKALFAEVERLREQNKQQLEAITRYAVEYRELLRTVIKAWLGRTKQPTRQKWIDHFTANSGTFSEYIINEIKEL